MTKSYNPTPRPTIRNEIVLLQQRLSVLYLFEYLYKKNPDFYDEKTDEIIEPYKSFLEANKEAIDTNKFCNTVKEMWKPHMPTKGKRKKTAK